jgi:putative flippase GtrA
MTKNIQAWIAKNRNEFTRFLKFAVVGVSGTFVDFGLLYLLHVGIGLHLVIANTISFTIAVINNFTWNRYWTYPDSRSKPISTQLGQFFIVNIFGWGINTGILLLLEPPLTTLTGSILTGLALSSAPRNLAHKIGYNFAKAAATGVVMFWNFFINRVWTYNDVA